MTTERRKVLLVEDSPTARRILALTLEMLGYATVEAEDVKGAIAAFDRESPTIVITDWNLPDGDGLEFCKHIRTAGAAVAATGYVCVIVLTARTEKHDAIAAIEAGADEFVTKPPHAGELRARLRTAERLLGLEATLAARVVALEDALAKRNASQERLVEAERLAAVGAVSITVRHEINNPLTGIIGYAQLALTDRAKCPPRVVEALESIGTAGREIAKKIARLDELKEVKLKDYVGGVAMLDLGLKPSP